MDAPPLGPPPDESPPQRIPPKPPRLPPQPPPPVPTPPPGEAGSWIQRHLPLVLIGAGIAVVLAVLTFALLSDGPDTATDTAASTTEIPATTAATVTTSPPTTAAPTTTSPPTTTPPTTAAPTTTPPTTTAETSTTTGAPLFTLTVGHWVAFPPFQQRDDDGLLTGFDIDILNAIAGRVGASVTWLETENAEMLEGTSSGRYDVAAGRITIGSYRDLDFTLPYFNPHYALIVDPGVADGLGSFADLGEGDTIGVSRGSQADEWATTRFANLGVRIIAFDGSSAAFNAHRSGEVQGVVSALFFPSVAAGLYRSLVVVDAIPTGQGFGFAVDPTNDDLRATLDEALTAIIDDGTYKQIYDRWFSVASGSVAPPSP